MADNSINKIRFRFQIGNLGCKCNRYEADAVAQYFEERGGAPVCAGEEADICLLNTCTVTAEAGRKSCQALRRMRRENPGAVLAVMGCHAQLENLTSMSDLQTGVSGRMQLAADCLALLAERRQEKGPLSERSASAETCAPGAYEELGSVRRQSETRAQLKICDGCNRFCTYCAICLARGRVRSRSREAILREAEALARAGHRELVLTATHLCSFEQEKGRDSFALIELLEELDQIPAVDRIRLGSLEPASLSDEMIIRMSGVRKLCPHFHLSLQSGSNTVLQRMGRAYTAERYAEITALLRRLYEDPGITTDMMVAFPEESDAEFEQSLDFAEKIAFSRIHVFRYSVREHTPAARMRQVDPAVSQERGARLQRLADRLAEQSLDRKVGRSCTMILEESAGDGSFSGYSERYDPLCLPAHEKRPPLRRGDLIECTVLERRGDSLLVQPLSLR